MQSVPLPTYVGKRNAKIFWLKQTTDFKSTKHKNNHLEGTETNMCSNSLNLLISRTERKSQN
jgi:hypothetical protein